MNHPMLDRRKLIIKPLRDRQNKVNIEQDHVPPQEPVDLGAGVFHEILSETVMRITSARHSNRPVMLAFGAHAIKNGLGPILIKLIEDGWVQHLATNGAGIIHDWEFAFQGKSSEDVRGNTAQGQFGLWEETGYHLNLAQLIGAYDGLGYGESVGRLIEEERHLVPAKHELLDAISQSQESPDHAVTAAAAADLLAALERHDIPSGLIECPHPWKRFSPQAAAFRLGVPFTAHPMIGHDIIYTHPLNTCAAIGRTAERDFLRFAHTVSRLHGGVYLSVGSAVMSPMVFEKSMSMAQNLALQKGAPIQDHFIMVVDLAESQWDWADGEPPENSADYYLRYCKTFSRMGGTMRYLSADNRRFLKALVQTLDQQKGE